MTTPTLLRLPAVEQRTGIKRTAIYAAVRDGTFPAPIKVGPRASAWIESEVSNWIEDRIEASRPKRNARGA